MASLSEDDLLPFCPQCGAWPMATKSMQLYRITFRCPRCHGDQIRTSPPRTGGGAPATRP